MMSDIEQLSEVIGALQKCAAALASTHGDAPAMRRIVNDVERIAIGVDRLEIDLEELQMKRGLPPAACAMIQIPAGDYHPDFWRDVDHEGLGGHRT